MLNDEELIALIKGGEIDRVEFTAATRDMDKLRRTICAFANDLPNHNQPGVIFVGLDDDGGCADLSIDHGLLEQFGGLRGDGKTLPFPSMTVAMRELLNCQVAVIQVEPSDNPPVKVGGRCWIRPGPRCELASPEDERRLTEKRRWGNLPFDMHGVTGATVETDLDMRRFENEYLPASVHPDVLEENRRDRGDQLKALRLVTPSGVPTGTAILMLGVDTRYWFPGAYIQFVRYPGTSVTEQEAIQKELSGTLPEQLAGVETLLKLNISEPILNADGARHVKKQSYPHIALRELVHNAVIHRNYENSNTPVRITWLSDRVEITSPGSVFGAVSRENFGTANATAYRNPTIAEAMKNMGFMERFGVGIQRARKALEENGNPLPVFDVQDNFISVTIREKQ